MGISLIEANDDLDVGDLDRVKKDLREASNTRAEEHATGDEATPKKVRTLEVNDDELPDNLRGKDIKDLVKIIQESQSTIGRMANDLGVQRQLSDRLLNLKRELDLGAQRPPTEKITIKAEDVLDNPYEAIDKVATARMREVENSTREEVQALRTQLAAQQFMTRHPDYQSLTGDADFTMWVRATPYRSRLADQAAQGDYSVADELLTEYKEIKKFKTPASKPEADVEAARAAQLEASNAGSKETGRVSKKIYRRADLLKLQIEDPDSYYDEGFQAEILRAYAEKRVK